jgi:putative membrane protein
MAAWGLIALLFISPFCALTSALFSARTLHHVLLVGVVPPLLLLAGAAGRVWRGPNAGVLALVNGAVLLVWHLPAAYTLALADTYAYWLMQVTLFGSALAFWAAVLAPGDTGGALVGLALATTLGGLLGVLLTFLPVPVYAFHLSTTPAWSMAPLVDQQLAGALMWTLGTLPYLAAAIALVARRFQAEVG